MANTFAPFGFRQYSGNGSAPTYEQVPVRIAYNATNIFFGDPVTPTNGGYVVQGDPSGPSTVQIAGIFVGCKYLSVSQKRTVWSNYWPGSDVASGNVVEGYIVNDPNARFLAQVGGSTSVGAAVGDINANCQYAIGTGNTANGISGAYVDISVSPTTTDTYPFRIVGLNTNPPGAPGTAAGAYNYVIVAFNNVSTKQLTSVG
jgi:hypothetical protein